MGKWDIITTMNGTAVASADRLLISDQSQADGSQDRNITRDQLSLAIPKYAVSETAHGLSVGDAVRFNGTAYVEATADTAANAEMLGLVVEVPDVDTLVFQRVGYATGLSGLTAGTRYYLQDAGGLGSTAGTIEVPLLVADSTTSGWLDLGHQAAALSLDDGAKSVTAAQARDHIDDTSNPHSVSAAQVSAIPESDRGVANGVAALNSGGTVPVGQLPPEAFASQPTPVVPLDIPTYDDDPSITHPSVVYVPTGVGGYTHWMAFTPYPDGSRENPSVVASNDGVTWVVPTGLTNPITDTSEAISEGYALWSDTHLLYHNGTLYLYFRGAGASVEGIYLTTSTDGVTWAAIERVFESATDTATLSPAVVHDGTQFVMYTVNAEVANDWERVEKRTSSTANGFSAVGAVTVTAPDRANYTPWHVDVQYENGRYHMLIATDYSTDQGRLLYLKSSDGATFTGRTDGRSIPTLGYAFDDSGHYRSSLVPVPGNPVNFDVYVATYQPGADDWRVALVRNVNLREDEPRASLYWSGMAREYNRLFIPAQQFQIQTGGTAAVNGTWIRYGGIEMPTGVRTSLVTNIGPIPRDWQGIDAYVIGWRGGGALASDEDIDFRIEWKHHDNDTPKNNSGAGSSADMPFTYTTSSTGNVAKILVGRTLASLSDHEEQDWDVAWLSVQRLGDLASDTLGQTFYFMGIVLEAYEAPYGRHDSSLG